MNLEEIQKKLDSNTEKIMKNLEKININEQNIQKNSIALEILKEYKQINKRMFIIIITILIMWLSTIGYLVYVLSDTGQIETRTQEIDTESIEYSDIVNGDFYGED